MMMLRVIMMQIDKEAFAAKRQTENASLGAKGTKEVEKQQLSHPQVQKAVSLVVGYAEAVGAEAAREATAASVGQASVNANTGAGIMGTIGRMTGANSGSLSRQNTLGRSAVHIPAPPTGAPGTIHSVVTQLPSGVDLNVSAAYCRAAALSYWQCRPSGQPLARHALGHNAPIHAPLSSPPCRSCSRRPTRHSTCAPARGRRAWTSPTPRAPPPRSTAA